MLTKLGQSLYIDKFQVEAIVQYTGKNWNALIYTKTGNYFYTTLTVEEAYQALFPEGSLGTRL